MCIRDRSLRNITFGNKVESIGENAFNGCFSLANIVIPNSVISIGEFAFYNCPNLSSITIGKKVESIGESAFSGCYSLTNITIKTTKNITESIAVNAFDGCLVSYLFYETTEFTLISFDGFQNKVQACLLHTSPSPRDLSTSRMPSSA